MTHKLRKVTLAIVFAGLAGAFAAPPAQANRGGTPTTTTTEPSYVPPPQYGQNPHPEVDIPDPYGDSPAIQPTVVPVDLPAVTDPGTGLAGGGEPLAPAPDGSAVLGSTETRPEPASPEPAGGFMGGILSRTGSEALPLARAGVAALALGLGLVILARRRRVETASL